MRRQIVYLLFKLALKIESKHALFLGYGIGQFYPNLPDEAANSLKRRHVDTKPKGK
jgi:hypothetical protein